MFLDLLADQFVWRYSENKMSLDSVDWADLGRPGSKGDNSATRTPNRSGKDATSSQDIGVLDPKRSRPEVQCRVVGLG